MKGALSQGMLVATEARKGKETDSSPETSEGASPANILTLAQ